MKYIKSYQIFESQEPHPGFPITEEEVHRLCKEYDITNYTINDDLSIDVEGDVILWSNQLKYIPLNFNYVTESFYIHNNKLISLKGSPKEVGGSFTCSQNRLMTLKGCPSEVGDGFIFYDNPIYTLVYTFNDDDNISELVEEFNDYNIVQDDKVVLGRSKAFINDFDLEIPNLDEVKKYYKIV